MPTSKKVTTPKKQEIKKVVKKTELKTSRVASAPSKNIVRAEPALPAGRSRTTLSIPVYSILGKEAGTMKLPEEIFGAKVSKTLLTQALRVYMANQKQHTSSTKTRGQVAGTTAKAYRQKGTGRARHGAKTAPLFVGGGVAFGPKPKVVKLDLPKKMKKAALLSALSDKAATGKVVGLSGIEKASGKTKEMSNFVNSLQFLANSKKKRASLLIVTGEKNKNAENATKNLSNVDVVVYNQINVYEVVRHQALVLTKEAVEKLGRVESIE